MKPFLKWAGNKSKLAEQIAGHLFPDGPDHDGCLISPFIGAGGFELYALAHGLVRPERCFFSDINARLIELWEAVRDTPDELIDWLGSEPTVTPGWRAVYEGNRNTFNRMGTYPVQRAALLIWLNRAGFNGLYRENRSGEFNVPIGNPPNGGDLVMPSADHIHEVSRLIQGVSFACEGFVSAASLIGASDLVYCDPPYVPTSATASFTAYSGETFGLQSQSDLASTLSTVRAKRIVASNSFTDTVRELYPEPAWARHEVTVHRSVAPTAKGRGKVSEYLLVRA